jgi:uncharacterized protein DUF5658
MARVACALLFVMLLGVCPLLAPASAPDGVRARDGAASPGRVLRPEPADVPHAPAGTTPTRPSRSPAKQSSAPPVILSRATPPVAALVVPPIHSGLLASSAESAAPLPSMTPFGHLRPVPPLPSRPPRPRSTSLVSTRPSPLVPLYAGFATLQALDYHSTRRALADGSAYEANPLMRSIVKSPPAFIAVKAAATAGVIVVGEKLWKKNRTGAVLFMAGTTAAMAVVVGRNYAVR